METRLRCRVVRDRRAIPSSDSTCLSEIARAERPDKAEHRTDRTPAELLAWTTGSISLCDESVATRAPPELSPHGDGRRTGMQGRGIPGSQKERRGKQRVGLSDPGHAHITLGNRADIRCRLTGPGAKGGMGFRA